MPRAALDVGDVRASSPWLYVLGAVGVLWLLARTDRGQAVAATAVGAVVSTAKAIVTPRGIRNNNPGNIEWIEDPAKRWRGMIGRDGRFGVFDTPANGVRAIGGELRASIRKAQTLLQAIHEWAPPHENDTDSYARSIERETGYAPSLKLTADMIPAVAVGIIKHENGQQPYALTDIAKWVNA